MQCSCFSAANSKFELFRKKVVVPITLSMQTVLYLLLFENIFPFPDLGRYESQHRSKDTSFEPSAGE